MTRSLRWNHLPLKKIMGRVSHHSNGEGTNTVTRSENLSSGRGNRSKGATVHTLDKKHAESRATITPVYTKASKGSFCSLYSAEEQDNWLNIKIVSFPFNVKECTLNKSGEQIAQMRLITEPLSGRRHCRLNYAHLGRCFILHK